MTLKGNSTGRVEGIRGGVRVITVPDVVTVVLRVLSTWINRMEGSGFMAVALFEGLSLLMHDSA